jgi:hypothetical protein
LIHSAVRVRLSGAFTFGAEHTKEQNRAHTQHESNSANTDTHTATDIRQKNTGSSGDERQITPSAGDGRGTTGARSFARVHQDRSLRQRSCGDSYSCAFSDAACGRPSRRLRRARGPPAVVDWLYFEAVAKAVWWTVRVPGRSAKNSPAPTPMVVRVPASTW